MVGPPPESWEVDPAKASAREVVDGLWRLRLPTPWPHVSHSNAYAIDRADGGTLLVDAGCGGHDSAWEALRLALEESGRTVADVRELVVTHFHSDHMGAAARLVEESGCTVSAHPAAEHFMGVWRRPDHYKAERERFARRLGVPAELVRDVADVREETEGIDGDFDVDRALVTEAVLPSAVGRWEVIETPGHAPSQVCLFLAERRLLIVGDLVGPVIAPFFDLGFTPDPVAEHLESLQTARALPAELVLPGHGRPIDDVPELFDENIAGIMRRADAVEGAVVAEPGTAFELFTRRFGRLPDPAERVWRLWELAGYLHHLGEVGRIERTPGEDGALRYAPAAPVAPD